MIEGGNWWRANEIVMRHLTRRLETRYRCRDKTSALDIKCLSRTAGLSRGKGAQRGVQSFEGNTFGSLDAFRLTARAMPEPSRGQVRIRVRATALGFADGLLVQGRYQIKPPLPYVPGGEIAGVVDAVGPEVSGLP